MEVRKVPGPQAPVVESNFGNQIVQSKVQVDGAGGVTITMGHFGLSQTAPGKAFAPDEFVQLKADLAAAQAATLKTVPGTQVTSMGSESGSVAVTSPSGQPVVLKEIARNKQPGQLDVIDYRDNPATQRVIDALKAKLVPIDFKDRDGTVTPLIPAIMPSALKEG